MNPATNPLREARKHAGLTQLDVVTRSRQDLPRSRWLSPATLSRMEVDGADPEKLDPFVVEYLCHLYGCDVDDVFPSVADGLKRYRKALRSRCSFQYAQPTLPGFGATVHEFPYREAPVYAHRQASGE